MSRPNTMPTAIKVLATANVLKSLGCGLPVIITGVFTTITPGGQGLQVIVGIPLTVLGAVLLAGVIPALQIYTLNPKGLIPLVVTSLLLSLALLYPMFATMYDQHLASYLIVRLAHLLNFATLSLLLPRVKTALVRGPTRAVTILEWGIVAVCAVMISVPLLMKYEASSKKSDGPYGIDFYRPSWGVKKREYQKTSAFYEAHEYAPLRLDSFPHEKLSDEELRQRNHRSIFPDEQQFILDQIIQPLGPHITEYQFERSRLGHINIRAQVSNDGFERLEKNPHVWRILLDAIK